MQKIACLRVCVHDSCIVYLEISVDDVHAVQVYEGQHNLTSIHSALLAQQNQSMHRAVEWCISAQP
jgi:hypothetical protein